MRFSELEHNWSGLEHQSSLKVRFLLQCSSCSSPLRDWQLEWSTDPGRKTHLRALAARRRKISAVFGECGAALTVTSAEAASARWYWIRLHFCDSRRRPMRVSMFKSRNSPMETVVQSSALRPVSSAQSSAAVRLKKGKSAATNNPRRMAISGRTVVGRRVRDLAENFADQLGGWAGMSGMLAANVRKAAELTALAEQARAQALRDPLGLVRLEGAAAHAVPVEDIVKIENAARRAVVDLGIKPAADRDVTLSLRERLQAEAEAAAAETDDDATAETPTDRLPNATGGHRDHDAGDDGQDVSEVTP